MKKIFCLIWIIILAGCSSDVYWELDTSTPYVGPYLDESYFEIEELSINNKGSGKAFEVTLNYAVDGDTAHFNTPYDDIYTSSFRFFNVDTEETYGTLEEWGKPASNYTKYILENAYSIVLQNDVNDALTDNYGRGLAWVWVKDDIDSEYELLNASLLSNGLATIKYTYGAGTKMYYNNKSYLSYLYESQSYGENNKLGMHGSALDPYWVY